jgi:DNA replication protein DnaC
VRRFLGGTLSPATIGAALEQAQQLVEQRRSEAISPRRFLKLLASCELLIIDELWFVPLSKVGAETWFEIFSLNYERGGTMVTSNLPSTKGPRCWAPSVSLALY